MGHSYFLGVHRERRFSPGKVADDAAVLERVAVGLRQAGIEVRLVDPDEGLPEDLSPSLVFAMCQSAEALAWLDRLERRSKIVNSPGAIRACHRVAMAERLSEAGVPTPRWRLAGTDFPAELGPGPWLKLGDVHSVHPADVRRVEGEREWREAREELASRGVARAIAQANVDGPVYKFYGVTGGFFRAFGLAPGFENAAREAAAKAASALGLEVYGGDGVCLDDGRVALIDVNDWPSFSRCRDDAVPAIVQRLLEISRNPGGL